MTGIRPLLHAAIRLSLLFLVTTVCPGQSVFERGGNIYYVSGSGSERRLTRSGGDSDPVLSPDGRLVVFIRTGTGDPIETNLDTCDNMQIRRISTDGTGDTTIVASKASNEPQELLACFSDAQFSEDGSVVFFLSAAWITSAAVHRIELRTGEISFVTPGNSLEVIRDGEFKGNLRISQHRNHSDWGSYDCDYIFSPEGKQITIVEGTCREKDD